MKKLISAGGVVLGFLVVPAAWAGGGSTLSGYGGNAGTVQTTVQKSGTLPFTGLSLTAFVVVGLVLVAAGFILRRRTNRPSA
ncbi:MAG TPA: LPXTG cell wall anchor domain-containing protein [Gaiellaceae bacterium]|nr:LPXTG cell wall anchor domain-containing protein [Gaiellaceae bacterium]